MRPTDPLLLVVLVGIPGSGKSTFARTLLDGAPAAGRRWRRISQDVLGTRQRCIKAAQKAVRSGENVLVDRCNFDAQQRSHWLQLGDAETTFDRRLAIYLPVPPEEARRRVLARGAHEGGVDTENMSAGKIASIVARMQGDLVLPELNEGFDEVLVRVDDGEEETMDGVGSTEAVLERVWSLSSLEDT